MVLKIVFFCILLLFMVMLCYRLVGCSIVKTTVKHFQTIENKNNPQNYLQKQNKN